MDESKDSWLYAIWQFTFILSGHTPKKTNWLRYYLRMWFMPIPVVVGLLCAVVFLAVGTIICNLWTILTGAGIFVTWSDHNSGVYLYKFEDISIFPTQVLAAIVWTCLGIGVLVYFWPHEALLVGEWVIYFVVAAGLVLLVVYLADKMDDRELPPHTGLATHPVTFYDPDDLVDSETT